MAESTAYNFLSGLVEAEGSISRMETLPSSMQNPLIGTPYPGNGGGQNAENNSSSKIASNKHIPGSSGPKSGNSNTQNPDNSHQKPKSNRQNADNCGSQTPSGSDHGSKPVSSSSSNHGEIDIKKPGCCCHNPSIDNNPKPGSISGQNPDEVGFGRKSVNGSNQKASSSDRQNPGSIISNSQSAGNISSSGSGSNGTPHALEPFRHQVAGQSLVFRYDAGTICKSLISRELRIYQTMPDVLKPHVPEFRGVVDIALSGPQTKELGKADEAEERMNSRGGAEHPLATQRLLDKVVKHQEHDNVYHFLLLENIVSGYHKPCVLDLKVGTRQHGDEAPTHKINYQVNKCRSTTSALLGVRLCGMQVYQPLTGKYIKVDKMEGRKMRENDFRDAMRHFLFNGLHVRRELIPLLLMKLQRLTAAVADCPTFRFYSSSLLIVYDGREFQCTCKAGSVQCKNGLLEQRSECCSVEKHDHDDINRSSLTFHPESLHDSDGLHMKAGSLNPNLSSVDVHNSCCTHVSSDASGSCQEVPFKESHGDSSVEQNKQKPQLQLQPEDDSGTCACQKPDKVVFGEQSVCLTQNSLPEKSEADIEQTLPSGSTERLKHPRSFDNTSAAKNEPSTDMDTVIEGGSSSVSSSSSSQRSLNGNVDIETRVENGPAMEPLTDPQEAGSSKKTKKKTRSANFRVGSLACECYARLVDARLVDFAHTTHAGLNGEAVVYEGPDKGCLLGLSTLLSIFTDIYDHTANEEP